MNYRLAKTSDINNIVNLHHSVRESYAVGFFSKTKKSFLREYYRLLINDPYEIILCAVDDNDNLQGFCSGSMDVTMQKKLFKKNKLRFSLFLLPSFISDPKLIKESFSRYSSIKNKDSEQQYTISTGARSEYWAWSKDNKDSESSVELLNRFYNIFYILGIKEVYFEVDEINKKVCKFHKFNGAEIVSKMELPDGRKRIIMKYNLIKKYN